MAEPGLVRTVDPHDGSVLESYPITDTETVDEVLGRAVEVQSRWRRRSMAERASIMRRIGARLLAAKDEAAALMASEMGKPLAEGRAEIDKCVMACDYYAAHAAEQLAPTPIEVEGRQCYVQFPPLGVVLAIMPWNYPFWQVMRAAAPTLMAGNTIVLKHASNVTGCALLLERLVGEVEGAQGLMGVIVLPGSQVTPLIADPRVAAVTLTGSEEVGVSVASACARSLKKSVLELGGSDPFIVLADANIAAAARTAARARFQNAGQSCIAAKRFIVVDEVAHTFEQAFVAEAAAVAVGDPRDPTTSMGPMAREDLRDELADQVSRAVDAGGRVATGGVSFGSRGAYFAPTVVTGVELGSPLAEEETFGPVAAVIRARDEAHAIEIANSTAYGLSSSLWTLDLERAADLAGEIQAGGVFVNGMTASDVRVPFGGVKRSGWGRELGCWGIAEFVNVQTVSVVAEP